MKPSDLYPKGFDAEEKRQLAKEMRAAKRNKERAEIRFHRLLEEHQELTQKMHRERNEAYQAITDATEKIIFFIRNYGDKLYQNVTK